MTDLLKPHKLSKCNLIQALEWITFGYEPVRPEDEVLENRKLYREKLVPNEFGFHPKNFSEEEKFYVKNMLYATNLLKKALLTKNIGFSSNRIYHNGLCEQDNTSVIFSQLKNFNIETIDFQFSENFRDISVTLPGESVWDEDSWSFHNVVFFTNELKKAFPKPILPSVTSSTEEEFSQDHSREYTTPYLDIIDELIAEKFYENQKLSLKKSLSFEIIKKMKSKGIRESKNIADIMATILRPVELQRGGTHSFPNKKS